MKNTAATKVNEGLISKGAAALNRGVSGAKTGAKAGALGGAALGALTGGGIPGAVTGALGGAAAGGLGGGVINAMAGDDHAVEVVVNGKRMLIPASHAKEMLATYGGEENAEGDSFLSNTLQGGKQFTKDFASMVGSGAKRAAGPLVGAAQKAGTATANFGKMAVGGAKGALTPVSPLAEILPGGSAGMRYNNIVNGMRAAVPPGTFPTAGDIAAAGAKKAVGDIGTKIGSSVTGGVKNLGTGIGSSLAQGASNLGSTITQGASNLGSTLSQGAGNVGNAIKGMAAAAPGGPAGAALLGAGLVGAGALGAHMLSKKKKPAESEEDMNNDEDNQTQVKEGMIGGAFKGMGKGAVGGGLAGALAGAGLGIAAGAPAGIIGQAALTGAKIGGVGGAALGAPVGAITDNDDEEGAAQHNIVVTGPDGQVEGSIEVTPHELEMLLNLVKSRQRKDTKVSLAKSLNDDEEVKAELSPKQKAIASKAAPYDKITGADFAAMRKVRKENTDIKAFIKSLSQKNYADANKYLKDIVDSKIKSKIESVRNEKLF